MKAHYILIAALCGLTGCREDNGAADAADRREMPPLKVSVMNMEQRTVELKSSWFGHLRGVEQADIRPQVSGTLIRQVYWDGSICDKGELLFEIDPATYQAAVDRGGGQPGYGSCRQTSGGSFSEQGAEGFGPL